MWRRAPMTTALLGIIGVVFLFEMLHGGADNEAVLIDMGAIMPNIRESGEYWRLFTAMFLHAGWLHWATNTWALYQLGTLYEVLFGTPRFVVTYFVSGLCASMASLIFSHDVAVGASGAIFGILGAFIFSLLRSPQYRHQRWTRSLVSQIVFWIVVNIIIGLSVKFIDNAAHLGGLVAGLLLGLLPHRVPPPSPGGMVIDVPLETPRQQQAYYVDDVQPPPQDRLL